MRKGLNLEFQGNLLIRVKIYKDIGLSFSNAASREKSKLEIYCMQDHLDIYL